jgi:hypothetical protein
MSTTMISQMDHKMQASGTVLEELLRKGAREMLQVTIELEVEMYLQQYADYRDERDRRQVVRNGYLPETRLETEKINGCTFRTPQSACIMWSVRAYSFSLIQ